MKNFSSLVLIIIILACHNPATNSAGDTPNTIAASPESGSTDGNCGANLLFRKGVVIHATNFDGTGKATSKSVSTATKVYSEGGKTISEWEMKNTTEGAEGKVFKTVYTCDGKLLQIDLSGLLPGNQQNTRIESSGLQFPLHVSVGETLPETHYSMVMTSGGKERKITSHIKDRKVEAKESITTPAGTFACYRISSVIEAEMDMPGMDEKSKKIMEEVKKKMGKNRMICWYVPDVTIIKMEFHMGDKLVTRSEITAIKK